MRFIKCLDWDSQFFGIKIGRINIDPIRLNLDTLKEALREAATCNIQCLYLEIGFSHPELLDYCSKENFSLVDCKTTLCKSLDSTENLENLKANNLSFEIKNEYNPGLEQIAEQISSQSRFTIDPKFGKQKTHALYREWARKSFHESYADDFIIYLKDTKPVGFITIRKKENIPFIDLLGVSNDHRGEGIAGHLIDAAQKRMLEKGHRKLKVTTQGHNIRALKTYESKHFRVESMNLFYHKWLN